MDSTDTTAPPASNDVNGKAWWQEDDAAAATASEPERSYSAEWEEQLLIATCVAFPNRAREIFGQVRATDFEEHRDQQIGLVIEAQLKAAGEVDIRRVASQLQCAGYLVEIVGTIDGYRPSTSEVSTAARAVVKARRNREIREAEKPYEGPGSAPTADEIAALHELEDLSRPNRRNVDTFDFGELLERYPALRPPLIDGLARIGEVINIIANPKVGKSWFVYYLAICIATRRYVFGRFATAGGRVLICDNELHPELLASRTSTVATAMGLQPADVIGKVKFKTLRGKLRSFAEVADEIASEFEPGELSLIVFDAKYRFNQEGQSENDNAAEARVYNQADSLAGAMQSSVAFVHHASRGSQSEKRVSDVGAGAGAQSRAADAHCIFREHDEPGVFVFEALVRSFAPVQPVPVRWQFPLWVPVDGLDPSKLRGRMKPNEQRQNDLDREGISTIASALLKGPATARDIRRLAAMGKDRCERLLDKMEAEGSVIVREVSKRGNPTREYTLKPDTEE